MILHGYDESPSTWVHRLATPLRLAGAAAVFISGVLHLQLWARTYRHLPSAVPGSWVVRLGFPLSAAAALALSGALVAWPARRRLLTLAALGFLVGSVVVLVLSRTTGVFGWTETGWSSGAIEVLVVEVVGVVLLGGAALVGEHASPD